MLSTKALLSLLHDQSAPKSHLNRLSQLVALAETDPRVLAIFLVGSYAKGVGDRVSDLDLVVFASAGEGDAVLQAAHEVLSHAEVLNEFSGTHAAGGSFWKLIYLDFSSVEVHVFEPETTFRLKNPCLSVWDPTNLQQNYLVEGEPIRHEDFAAYEYGDEGLIWDLVDCIKWLSRGQSELARWHIEKIATEIEKRKLGT